MVILTVAAHCKCSTEWAIHVAEARRAGLQEDIIVALQQGVPPPFKDVATRKRDKALFDLACDLVRHYGNTSDERYSDAASVLNDKALVEVTAIVGYYTYVAMTLNFFAITPESNL